MHVFKDLALGYYRLVPKGGGIELLRRRFSDAESALVGVAGPSERYF